MTKPVDMKGQAYEVGQTVLFPHLSGRSAMLAKREVVSIDPVTQQVTLSSRMAWGLKEPARIHNPERGYIL